MRMCHHMSRTGKCASQHICMEYYFCSYCSIRKIPFVIIANCQNFQSEIVAMSLLAGILARTSPQTPDSMCLELSSVLHLSIHLSFRDMCQIPRLDPRMFGHPNMRLRAWRICYHKGHRTWSCKHSFEDLAKLLLHDPQLDLKLDYTVYFRRIPVSERVGEHDLTERLSYWYCNNFFSDQVYLI